MTEVLRRWVLLSLSVSLSRTIGSIVSLVELLIMITIVDGEVCDGVAVSRSTESIGS